MKKILNIMLVLAAIALLSACKPSTIEAQTEVQTNEAGLPYGVIETHETMKYEKPSVNYVIPEGAKGPADSYVEGDAYKNYPADKMPVEDDTPRVEVRYFYLNSEGMHEDFDVIEGTDTLTAEDLFDILIVDGCLSDASELVSFEQEGDTAVITVSALDGMYEKATPEELAQAVASTFIDNFGLDTATIKVGDELYGPLEYVD